MANKRRIMIRCPHENEEQVCEETWWEWFRWKYSKYWYGLLALTAILFSMLEILRHEEIDWNVSAALIAGLGLLVLFMIGYLKLWGKDKEEEEE